MCDYTGEILSTDQARARQHQYDEQAGMNYLLVLKEHLPNRVVRTSIDPTQRGGVARCINHSCRPNLRPTIVRDGSIVPTVRFYATRSIVAAEELTFDYGALLGSDGGDGGGGGESEGGRTVCRGGEANCRGFLPFSPEKC